ncbi:major facilitator superfamily domain-containing protein [Russula brevipes]|nr:major facilitator superfamily domain-containing protein [Russula brevipes]
MAPHGPHLPSELDTVSPFCGGNRRQICLASQTMDSSSSPSPSTKYSDKLRPDIPQDGYHDVPKDWKFWCIIFSLSASTLLTSVDLTSIGAALPTIVRDLKGQQFIWVGSAYSLGSTAIVPLCGGLAQIIGRRPIMLSALFFFSLGSTLCGTASGMRMLIAGRAVQGLGAGAITSSVQIVLSDLVTLRERGAFSGCLALAWAVGGGVGPVIGGSLAENGKWYASVYINLPICAFNMTMVILFLRLKTPPATLREKLRKMDIIGNILVIVSTTSIVIALTWGGVLYPWSSTHVISPLVFGLIYFCKPPVAPILHRMSWTAASGYLQEFIMVVLLVTLSYWYAVFFEACQDRSPARAGVDLFGLSYSTSLIALVTGIAVRKTGKYVILTYTGWVLTIVGAGLLTTLSVNSSLAKSVGFQLVVGAGLGVIFVVCLFPVLASTPVTQTAPAMALFVFSRNFGSIWGVTAGGAILQNELKKKLPAAFLAQFPQGVEIAFATIPIIPSLGQPLKDQVRDTFADALKVVWQVVLGIAIAGFLCSLGMRQLELHTEIDEDWGRQDLPVGQSVLESGNQPASKMQDQYDP